MVRQDLRNKGYVLAISIILVGIAVIGFAGLLPDSVRVLVQSLGLFSALICASALGGLRSGKNQLGSFWFPIIWLSKKIKSPYWLFNLVPLVFGFYVVKTTENNAFAVGGSILFLSFSIIFIMKAIYLAITMIHGNQFRTPQ